MFKFYLFPVYLFSNLLEYTYINYITGDKKDLYLVSQGHQSFWNTSFHFKGQVH